MAALGAHLTHRIGDRHANPGVVVGGKLDERASVGWITGVGERAKQMRDGQDIGKRNDA